MAGIAAHDPSASQTPLTDATDLSAGSDATADDAPPSTGAAGLGKPEVRFYHLHRTPLEDALPRLLEKTLERGWRAVVMAGSTARVEALNSLLWTFRPDSFLPHGTAREGLAPQQPIWLTAGDENPNGATVLFLCDGAVSDRMHQYDLICDMFDGHEPGAVAAARARWRAGKAAGFALAYYQQDAHGHWSRSA